MKIEQLIENILRAELGGAKISTREIVKIETESDYRIRDNFLLDYIYFNETRDYKNIKVRDYFKEQYNKSVNKLNSPKP